MIFPPTDIAYFLGVAREGHVGRAAAAGGVTQSAVSKAIQRLEAAAGVALFERSMHGVRLTAQGQLFYEAAVRFDAQHTELARTAAELRAQHAGLLRLGLTNADGEGAVVRTLAELVRQRPGLRLSVTIGRSDVLNDLVERGTLDLAVVPGYPGLRLSAHHTEIGQDTAVLAARHDHPLARKPGLQLADLADVGWVLAERGSAARQMTSQALAEAGLPEPKVVLQVEYTSSLVMGLVATTDLVCLAPSSVLRDWAGRVNPLPLPALAVRRSIVLLARKDRIWSPLMQVVRERLMSYAA